MFLALLILSFSALEYLSLAAAFFVAIISIIFLELSSVFPPGLESLGFFLGCFWILLSRTFVSRELFPALVSFVIIISALAVYTLVRMAGALWFTKRTSFALGELFVRGGLEMAFNILFLFLFFIFFLLLVKIFHAVISKR